MSGAALPPLPDNRVVVIATSYYVSYLSLKLSCSLQFLDLFLDIVLGCAVGLRRSDA